MENLLKKLGDLPMEEVWTFKAKYNHGSCGFPRALLICVNAGFGTG